MEDDFVIIRRYHLEHEGDVARSMLAAAGIHARVFGGGIADAGLSGASPVVLRVLANDAEDAERLLRAAETADEDPVAGDETVVRCPRCELEYCYFGHRRASIVPGAIWHAAWQRLTSAKRWHCSKCEHAWDDEHAGPAIPSQFAADDPRPVFRLMHNRAGMGAFLGLTLGLLATMITPYDSLVMALAGLVVGGVMGRAYAYPVCSAPACRARLRSGATACPKCDKTIAGTIARAPEHYAAVAEIRREFTALRRGEEAADHNNDSRAAQA